MFFFVQPKNDICYINRMFIMCCAAYDSGSHWPNIKTQNAHSHCIDRMRIFDVIGQCLRSIYFRCILTNDEMCVNEAQSMRPAMVRECESISRNREREKKKVNFDCFSRDTCRSNGFRNSQQPKYRSRICASGSCLCGWHADRVCVLLFSGNSAISITISISILCAIEIAATTSLPKKMEIVDDDDGDNESTLYYRVEQNN